ncbi:lamin tail domain-containing protein [Chloroflexota bacterium]
MSGKFKWVIAILAVLSVVVIAQATALQSTYLPLVYNQQPTATPTRTPTPTIAPTPSTECLSGKTSGVCITDVIYQPTKSLLDEVVSIKNLGSSSEELDGWRLSSERGYKFDIMGEFTLPAGATVKVWTKPGDNNSTNIFMNRTTQFWKDNQDCAYLKDNSEPTRKTIDKICWKDGHFYFPALWGIP